MEGRFILTLACWEGSVYMPNSAKSSRLPVLVIVLMAMQPLLDIVSYFWSGTGKSNLPTLALRMGLLAAAGSYAFCISDHKRV